tara:strand:+ start:451 stop:2061 length:1611 start_codon:yes stop_codon:yes gene_type:complete
LGIYILLIILKLNLLISYPNFYNKYLNIKMNLIKSTFFKFIKKRQKTNHYSSKNSLINQNLILKKFISNSKNTFFGNKFNFKKIKNYSDFKKFISVNKYEDLLPYIKDMKNGKQRVLWYSNINNFAISSGTTDSKSKYIPLSYEAINDCHKKASKDLIITILKKMNFKKLFFGKCLIFVGSLNVIERNFIEGDLSAILVKSLPLWTSLFRLPKNNIALIKDWEIKVDKMIESSINKNVTSVVGVPSWILFFFNKVLQKTNKKKITEIWPNLELFIHGGIEFSPYKKQFDYLTNHKLKYVNTYNASEGFFGFQDKNSFDDMILLTNHGIFYEFISLEHYCIFQNNSNLLNYTIDLSKVRIGIDYVLIITTNSGLWRYIIGDIIEFTKLNPFRFIIKGRTKQFINTFGEELMVHNSDKAIELSSKKFKLNVVDYTVAPNFNVEKTNGYHEWIIEFSDNPQNLDAFTKYLDEKLKNLNSDYEAKRSKNLIISLPKVHLARKNLFFDWLKSKNKLGGQNKIPRLSSNRNYIDQLIKLNNK